jgi:hypothetical protein
VTERDPQRWQRFMEIFYARKSPELKPLLVTFP